MPSQAVRPLGGKEIEPHYYTQYLRLRDLKS